MDNMNNPKRPAIIAMFGAIAVGLASFIVWLLRLPPRRKQPPGIEPQRVAAASGMDKSASIPSKSASGGARFTEKGAPGAVLQQLPEPHRTAVQSPSASGSSAESGSMGAGGIPSAQPASPASSHWSAPTRYLAGVGLVLFFLWLIYFSKQTLTMLIFAALIAILVRPATHFLNRRLRFSPGLAVLFVYLLVTLLLFALPLLFIPNLVQGINSLASFDWQGLVGRIADGVNGVADQMSTIPLIGGGVANSLESLTGLFENLSSGMTGEALPDVSLESMVSGVGQTIGFFAGILGPLISGIVSLVFMLLISLQMSLASGKLRGWILEPVPERFKGEIGALLDRIQLVWVSFLRGQFALMVVMGVLVWLMNLLLGTPQALLLGLLSGLLEVIPSLGPILAAIPAVILAVLFGSSHFPGLHPLVFALILIAGYVLLNLVENQVLVPQILGDAVSLPPLIVLVGVTIAGAKAGIVGVFLATPLIASGREIMDYIYNKVSETPEIEQPAEEKPSLVDQFRSLLGRVRLPFRRKTQMDDGQT